MGNLSSVVKLGLIGTFLVVGFSGCSHTPLVPKTPPVANLIGKKVLMKSAIPFKKDAWIKEAIKKECKLPTYLSTHIKDYAKENNINIVFDNNSSSKSSGYYLKLEIVDAISESSGNIRGRTHRKITDVNGSLYHNNQKLASFTGRGFSNGVSGWGPNVKGSCTVLDESAEYLGEGLANWLKAPRDKAHIGGTKVYYPYLYKKIDSRKNEVKK